MTLKAMVNSQKNLESLSMTDFHQAYSHYSNFSLSSISISGSHNEDAYLRFMSGSTQMLFVSLQAETGSFLVKTDKINILEARKDNEVYFEETSLRLKNVKFLNNLLFKQIPQYKLLVEENYWDEPVGWTNNSISQCGRIYMLGGYRQLAGGEISKAFKELPPHAQIRVVANFHFIDGWQGEMGFLKVDIGRDKNMEYVWTEKYDYTKSGGDEGINLCGNKFPENRPSVHIDINIPHSDDSIVLAFGSTLNRDPKDASFGVSGLQIFIK